MTTVNSTSSGTFPMSCQVNATCDGIKIPSDLAQKLPANTTITTIHMNVSRERKSSSSIISNILSVKISPQLSTPFEIPITLHLYRHEDVVLFPNQSFGVFYYEELRNSSRVGHWANDGVEIVSNNSQLIVANLYHLTSFAVLVQIHDVKVDSNHQKALEMITYVGCGISLFAFLLTFGTLASIQSLTSSRSVIHMNLVAALGIGQAIFLTGINATGHMTTCKIVAVLLHYFFTAAFGWMLVEGIHLYAQVINVFPDGRSKLKFYYTLGWGTPVVLVAVSAAINSKGYGTSNACWISMEGGFIWAFVGPVVAVICANLFIMGRVMKVVTSSVSGPNDTKGGKRKEKVLAALKALFILIPILGTTWIFGMLAVNKETLVFQYLFTIFNSMQGLLIFLVYCVFNSEVRAAVDRFRRKHRTSKILSKSTGQATISDNREARMSQVADSVDKGFSKMKSSMKNIPNISYDQTAL